MNTVLPFTGEYSGSVSRIQPHTAIAYFFNVYSPFKRQKNTSPASNTNNDKSADAAPESDMSH